MGIILTKNLKRFLLLAILVRAGLSFWTGHPWDFEVFVRVGHNIATGSSLYQLRNFYVPGLGQPIFPFVGGLGYLPAWGLYTGLAYIIYGICPFSPFFYYFLLKLAPIFGDLAVALLISVLTLKLSNDIGSSEHNFLLFLLCPFVIFVSSVWGMFDSIALAFTLASIVLLFSDKISGSAFFLGLAVYLKVIPIMYLPIIFLFLKTRKKPSEQVLYCIISLAVPIAFTIIPITLFGWSFSQASMTIISQTEKTGEVLTYWNLTPLLSIMLPNIFTYESMNAFFSFPLIRYLWILGLTASYLLFHELQSNLPHQCGQTEKLQLLLCGFLCTTILFLLSRTFISEQFVIYLLPTIILLWPRVSTRLYWFISTIALVFLCVNTYPFAFAYLVNTDLWNIFNYLATTTPYSTIRYMARFMIAIIFDLVLVRIMMKLVKR